ncbi:MAG: SBBP repeat-containing protein, partial [Candidatus Zixiibacteriota bacterium]
MTFLLIAVGWLAAAMVGLTVKGAGVTFSDPALARLENAASHKSHAQSFSDAFTAFTPNQGQFPDEVLFRSNVGDAVIWLAPSAVYYQTVEEHYDADASHFLDYTMPPMPDRMTVHTVRMAFLGSNGVADAYGLEQTGSYSNYFIGNDPGRWRTNVPGFRQVVYEELYPGIDARFRISESRFEYDLLLHPGADPDLIHIRFQGVDNLSIHNDGSLTIETIHGTMSQSRPIALQLREGVWTEVSADFQLHDPQTIGIRPSPQYDPSLPLLIDPVVDFSTYIGGSGSDYGQSVALDAAGNSYITGYLTSVDFPVESAYDSTYAGGGESGHDAFVFKLAPRGQALLFSTYLGGGTGDDRGIDIAVDAGGNPYICGVTGASDFPTVNAAQATNAGMKDAFVVKMAPTGDALIYSTYLGGSSDDFGSGIAVDDSGRVYVTGNTESSDFNLSASPYDNSLGGAKDAFVTR